MGQYKIYDIILRDTVRGSLVLLMWM